MRDEPITQINWPCGSGEMARRIREHDWTRTPIGSIQTWTPGLKSLVQLMVASDIIMVAPWGPEGILLFNDACSRLIGPRSSIALGRPVFDVLPELRQVLEPQFAEVRAGKTMKLIDQLYPFVRKTERDDAWFDVSHVPVRGEDGSVDGILTTLTETTGRVVAERLRDAAEQRTSRDLTAMIRLHQLGSLFVREGTLDAVLGEIVDAAISFTDADFGNIQLIDPDTGDLRIVSQRGFPKWWVDFWNNDARGQGAYGTALERGTRVIIEDVEQSEIFAGKPALDVQLQAGVRAVQSTPLIDRSGERLGMFSTHFRTRKRPDRHALALLDLLSHQAAEIIARARVEAALRESEQVLASDLANAERLRSLSERLVLEENFQAIYDEVLSATIAITRADAGTIQIYDPATKKLELIASQHFSRTITDYFHRVDAGSRTACGVALKTGERAFVDFPDEVEDLGCQLLTSEGIRSAVAFPLMSRAGTPLGMLNAHWRTSGHRLSESELRFLELLARQAADLIEHRKAEAAVRESEEKYRTLFNTIDEGFAIMEAVFDDRGKVDDLIFREINRAYQKIVGFTPTNGRRAKDYVPNIEAHWLEKYARVIATGEPYREEGYVQDIERWLSVHLSLVGQPGSHLVAAVFNDITERKRAEIATRESEQRQAFLLQLSDALRAQPNADSVANCAIQMIADKLVLDRCYTRVFCVTEDRAEITHQFHRGTIPPMPANMRLSDFPDGIRQTLDRTLVFEDIVHAPDLSEVDRRNVAALGIGAIIVAPLRRGPRNVIWSLTAITLQPRRWSANDIALVEEAAERTWVAIERARAEAQVKESEARFQQFAAASSGALWIRDAATGILEYVSPAIAKIYGVEPEALLGGIEKWAATIVPDDRETALEHIEKARQGVSVTHEFRIQRQADQAFHWIRDTNFPLRDENGNVQRIGGIAEDATEAKLAVEHQGVLLAELQHRVRNIMAVIRVIAARTGERAKTVSDYAELMNGRLLALARVQTLLTRTVNVSIGIAGLVHDEINTKAAHESQFEISGPNVSLSPKAAEVLTLAVHELATNALKYGALSVLDGKVTVHWSTYEKCGAIWLSFEWTEEGAPVRPKFVPGKPRRRGFGIELIEGRIPYELGGQGRVTIEKGGAHCHLEFPLMHGASLLETGAPQRMTVFGGALDMTGQADLTGYRVLVVEDDYYLASDIARALMGLGVEVLGPCSSEAAARAALAAQRPDAVLLDINLGSGLSFKLAETLKDSGIPFAIMTGYNQSAIPAEFDGMVRLEKPAQLRRIVGAISKLLTRAG